MTRSSTECNAAAGDSIAGKLSAESEELLLASRAIGDNRREVQLSVPGIRCGGCIQAIERALIRVDNVVGARVNLTAKRVTICWRSETAPPPVIRVLADLGYQAHLYDVDNGEGDCVQSQLFRALAVAGFAAGNIMLLSVSVWSGAGEEARNLFHWLSAFLALPTIAYSGRVFYRSAWAALRRGRTNMDVPISIGIALATGISLYDTMHKGVHAYFDASVMLVFFLLIGRTLEHLMRERARSAVRGLARLATRGAMVDRGGGDLVYLPVEDIRPGMSLVVSAGIRIPVDGCVESGNSELDCSLVTGESAPVAAAPGARVKAGMLNLTGPLRIVATATAEHSFLAEMLRLMEAAESGRGSYRRIADRAARLYAPVVHTGALLSFIGWAALTGDIHHAVSIAIAVLIITCPCALGLAVPMVQLVAARRLFEHGIMVKDGSSLERLSEVDAVVFDKTGTVTLGRLELRDGKAADPDHLALAGNMAACSRHPLSCALLAAHKESHGRFMTFDQVEERPGYGIEAASGADIFRLGRADWALAGEESLPVPAAEYSCVVLAQNGRTLTEFSFDDPVRPGACEAIAALQEDGLAVELLSGDHAAAVEGLARKVGIARFMANADPGMKVARLQSLAAGGRKVLMVGDGLNDTPALAMAHVSMAPAGAADIGRNAADFVFLRDNLLAVPLTLEISRRASRLIRQNFALAVLYNLVALPFAVMGGVTPLIAALAMSASSILVVANAMRLDGKWAMGQSSAASWTAAPQVNAAIGAGE